MTRSYQFPFGDKATIQKMTALSVICRLRKLCTSFHNTISNNNATESSLYWKMTPFSNASQT